MRKGLGIILLCLAAHAALGQLSTPLTLPKTAPTSVPYRHAGWPILDSLEGDINGDEREDILFIYQAPEIPGSQVPRPLILAVVVDTKTDFRLADSSSLLLQPDKTQPYRPYALDEKEVRNAQTLFLEDDTLVYQTNHKGYFSGLTETLRFCYRQGRFILINYATNGGPFGQPEEELTYSLATGNGTYKDEKGQTIPFSQKPPYPLPGLDITLHTGTLLTNTTLAKIGKAAIPPTPLPVIKKIKSR